jgi:hypothetical protein
MTNSDDYSKFDLGEGILTADGSKSSEIMVGIVDHLGNIIEVVTLETLARTGDGHQLFMSNYGHVGEVVYELWTLGTETLLKKLGHLRMLQATSMVPPGKHNCSSKIYDLNAEGAVRERRNCSE